jgi:class 3 adenylate cyclase
MPAQIDSVGETYCAAVGHVATDHAQSVSAQIMACLQLAKDMLEVGVMTPWPQLVQRLHVALKHCHSQLWNLGVGSVACSLTQYSVIFPWATLQAVQHMPYPDTLGKMELRIGLHVGPVYAGVLGVKFPR